jgi:hypothetical protein
VLAPAVGEEHVGYVVVVEELERLGRAGDGLGGVEEDAIDAAILFPGAFSLVCATRGTGFEAWGLGEVLPYSKQKAKRGTRPGG